MYVEVTYELASPMKAGTFASDRAFLAKGGAKTAPVSGIGDEAYYWWSPQPGRTRPVGIVFRTKSSQLNIFEVTSSDSIEIFKPRLMQLAKSPRTPNIAEHHTAITRRKYWRPRESPDSRPPLRILCNGKQLESCRSDYTLCGDRPPLSAEL
jgi:hypothetical protein